MSTGYDNSIRWWNGRSESEHAAAKYKDTAYTAIEYWRRQMKSVEELPTLVANDPLLSPESRDYALSTLRELPPKDFRIDWEKGP